MEISKVEYLGGLRTKATHLKSGEVIITDAPTDNQGKGQAFSPTDLMSTSLASCMLTLMGIAANTHSIFIDGTVCSVQKFMAANPRRVEKICVDVQFPENSYSDKEKKILELAARTCPVGLSLSENTAIVMNFEY
jgi:putative redox protein